MLIWFDAFCSDKKFKMSFIVVWHMVCGCSGWFGVVICGLGTIAYGRPITFFPVRHFYLVFDPGMAITKYIFKCV